MISLKGIKLLTLDVDGVFTDGGLYYGPEGVVQKFNSADGAGIIELRKEGSRLLLFPSGISPQQGEERRILG